MFAIALAILVPAAYGFQPDVRASYSVTATFDGFLPLFGGQDGKVEVSLGVDAVGLPPDEEGNPRVVSELKTLEVRLNDAKFPLGVENVKSFFPRTTISMTPQGQVLKSDAPDMQLGFRLPGLDSKRFPDITYLPIAFPKEGLEVNREFQFTKAFGGSDVGYFVMPTAITEDRIELKIRVEQGYTTLEDIRLQVVEDKQQAAYSVTTALKGEGKATFDRKLRLVTDLEIAALAVSKATDLKTNKESERRLRTVLKTKLSSASDRLAWSRS